MPRLATALPKYRKHKSSGQGIVTLSGVDHYLGPHGTKASKLEYDRVVGEWLENGRSLPSREQQITIVELAVRYWRFAALHYVKAGKPTDEQHCIKAALKPLRELYGRTNVGDLGPLALKAVRQRFIAAGNSRKYINKNVGRIKRMFKWGVEEELVPVTVYQSLVTVAGLRQGKTIAPDHPPVLSVPDDIVDKTLPHLRPVVADMVQLQRLTGCRPGEVCILRPKDIDRTDDIWEYRPGAHKNEHFGKARVILLGPKAQAIVAPYLLRASDVYCFPTQGKRNISRNPRLYREAIQRACDKAKIPRWNPNQLRHSAGTEICKLYGLEAAQVVLGHAQADVTQIYAERDMARAKEVMREVG